MHNDIFEVPLQHQLDERWIERYRQITFYDPSWWWAPAGPMSSDELRQWDQLIEQEPEATTKGQLNQLIIHSREREVATALTEHREPHFHYPVLAHSIEDVRS